MKNRLLLFTMLSILSLLAIPQISLATANTVGANWTASGGENCTITVLSTAQKTSTPTVATAFEWNITLNVTNTGEADKTCEVNYTSYTYVSSTLFSVSSSTGDAITVTNTTDADSRRVFNYTSETVSAGSSAYEQIIVNFTSGITSQASVTQRLVDQLLRSITNNGDVTITNINSSSVTYDNNWATSSIRVWDCGTSATCGDQIGSASGKTELTGVSKDTTNKYAYFVDTSLAPGTSYYAIEGSMTPVGNSYYYEEEGSGGVQTQQPVSGNQYQQVSGTGEDHPLKNPLVWVFIGVILLVAVIPIWAIWFK